MTLFSLCSPPGSVYERALDFFYGGKPDERTVALQVSCIQMDIKENKSMSG
jgi:uncharacterized protein (DUF1810 family)